MQVFIQIAGDAGVGKSILGRQLQDFLQSRLSKSDEALCVAVQHTLELAVEKGEELEFHIAPEYHPPTKAG